MNYSTLIFNEYVPAAIVFGLPFVAVIVAVVPSGTSIVSEATCDLADFLLRDTRIIPKWVSREADAVFKDPI